MVGIRLSFELVTLFGTVHPDKWRPGYLIWSGFACDAGMARCTRDEEVTGGKWDADWEVASPASCRSDHAG
jgi:hypothetical protein